MTKVDYFLDFWLAEFETKIKNHHVMVNRNLKTKVIPGLPYDELLNYIDDDTFYNFTNQEDDVVLSLYPKKTQITETVNLFCFLNVDDVYTNSFLNKKYILKLISKLDLDIDYLRQEEGSLEAIKDNFGSFDKKTKLRRVLIATPIYQRLEVLDLYLEYMLDYLIPALRWENLDVCFALVGEEYESETVLKRIHCKKNVFFLQLEENNLGLKKNKLINIAQDSSSDNLLWIDSDDFFHPKTCLSLINLCVENDVWSAIENFCFYDSNKKEYLNFEGYPPGHNLFRWGMGSGRVFSKELFSYLDNPFPLQNRSMDDGIRRSLQNFNIKHEERLLFENDYLPIGLKTKTNIWSAKNYKTEKIRSKNEYVNWLPKHIKSKLEHIEYDN